jgi:nucleoside 2-deoxyribosyltransferase
MRYVYVAGPLASSGNYVENIRNAVRAAESLRGLGLVPFVPHLNALWNMMSPHSDYDYWLPMDLAWIDRCEAVLRLPGESKGADMETAYAERTGKPVFGSVADLLNWAVAA